MNSLLKVDLINLPLTEENQVSEHWILVDLCDSSYGDWWGSSVMELAVKCERLTAQIEEVERNGAKWGKGTRKTLYRERLDELQGPFQPKPVSMSKLWGSCLKCREQWCHRVWVVVLSLRVNSMWFWYWNKWNSGGGQGTVNHLAISFLLLFPSHFSFSLL